MTLSNFWVAAGMLSILPFFAMVLAIMNFPSRREGEDALFAICYIGVVFLFIGGWKLGKKLSKREQLFLSLVKSEEISKKIPFSKKLIGFILSIPIAFSFTFVLLMFLEVNFKGLMRKDATFSTCGGLGVVLLYIAARKITKLMALYSFKKSKK